jgi:hypothetical protein
VRFTFSDVDRVAKELLDGAALTTLPTKEKHSDAAIIADAKPFFARLLNILNTSFF